MVECYKIIPVRAVVAILIFFGSFTSYMLKVDISIIVINISDTSHYSINKDAYCWKNQSYSVRTEAPPTIISNMQQELKPLNPVMVATMFSIYNWGYSFSILLAEPVAEKMGIVRVVGYSTLITALLTILCPVAYEAGVFILLAVRFLIGFLSGFVFPLLQLLILKWSPMNERNAFAFSLYGTSFGIIATYPISASILKRWAWDWITYILGIFAIIWSMIWLFYVTDRPIEHRYISGDELRCIEFRHVSLTNRGRRKRIPWREIIKSVPVWALFLLLWGNTWNLSFYIDYMPLYFYTVLDYDVFSASTLTSVPILTRMVFSWACLPLAKCLILGRCFNSVGVERKLFTIFSHVLPALIQLGLVSVMICNEFLSTFVLILFLTLNGAIIGGGSLNTTDLTPHFAASVHNALQALLCFAGICMPYAVAFILLYFNNHVKGWMVVLILNSAIYLIGGIIFLIFGSGSVQPWDVLTLRRNVFRGLIAENQQDDDEEMEMH